MRVVSGAIPRLWSGQLTAEPAEARACTEARQWPTHVGLGRPTGPYVVDRGSPGVLPSAGFGETNPGFRGEPGVGPWRKAERTGQGRLCGGADCHVHTRSREFAHTPFGTATAGQHAAPGCCAAGWAL